ncbi:unknown [Bacteroides sp. CAG:1076]|nr:unknown [Bacteroides sp. CAG:1076]
MSGFWFNTLFANLLSDALAEVLRDELLVLNKIPESKVTFTACKPLLSVTCSTSAP